jgi:lactate dehydrogenase-like 2-hydroxyacid dehydrogenase
VDEDYISWLVEHNIINYACDVLQNEQDIEKLKSSKLYRMNKTGKYDNLVITPHVCGVTVDSQEKALKSIIRICT